MATLLGWLAGGRGVTPSMTACQYPMAPGALERDRLYQHKVSLVVRYFMIPCNICLILLATSTLGFAVLLFLNNCRCPWSRGGRGRWRLGGSRCCQRGFSRGSLLRWGRSRCCQLPTRLFPLSDVGPELRGRPCVGQPGSHLLLLPPRIPACWGW